MRWNKVLFLVGPSFPSMSSLSEPYLLESIVQPDAVIANGFVAGAMYTGYENELTPQEVADLIAFIKSLE